MLTATKFLNTKLMEILSGKMPNNRDAIFHIFTNKEQRFTIDVSTEKRCSFLSVMAVILNRYVWNGTHSDVAKRVLCCDVCNLCDELYIVY